MYTCGYIYFHLYLKANINNNSFLSGIHTLEGATKSFKYSQLNLHHRVYDLIEVIHILGEMTGVQETGLAGKTVQHSGLCTNRIQEFRNPDVQQSVALEFPLVLCAPRPTLSAT